MAQETEDFISAETPFGDDKVNDERAESEPTAEAHELTHWPSGTRDVTEFPTFEVTFTNPEPEVEISSPKEHLQSFLKLDGVGAADYTQQKAVGGLTQTDQRLRSYRKLYERLGLMYRAGEMLKLSEIGADLRDFEIELTSNLEQFAEKEKEGFVQSLRSKAIAILARDQLINPTESQRHKLPADCDVFPFRCIWQAMLDLDNKLHYEEINRVLLYVMKMNELPDAIATIQNARSQIAEYAAATPMQLSQFLGDPVFDDQAAARITSWFTLAGWGGLVIEQVNQDDGFRHLVPQAIPLIRQILATPPIFFNAANEDEWFEHYLRGALPAEDITAEPRDIIDAFKRDLLAAGLHFNEKTIQRFVAGCQTKPFIILTGLSGSGKTKLAQAFAHWLTPTDKLNRYELVAVGPDWSSKDYVLGYADALDQTRYSRTQALDLILNAENNRDVPFVLIFDEMNLSHVERYFADILSAIESDEAISLHSDEADRDGVPSRITSLPRNLFIIGTVNVDDTTYMFSPKVLDRANVIEFRVDQDAMSNYLEQSKSVKLADIDGKGAKFARSLLSSCQTIPNLDTKESRIVNDEILLLFKILANFNSEFGYRTASEIRKFIAFHKNLATADWNISEAIDAQIFQKILPKLHGSRRKIEPLLTALAVACNTQHKWTEGDVGISCEEILSQAIKASSLQDDDLNPLAINSKGEYKSSPLTAFYPLSFAKLQRMLRGLEDGFTSFAEA